MIDGQPSVGVQATSGFPEGCPLSVCSMALVNVVIHQWFQIRHPRLELLTYVDNIELVGDETPEIDQGLQSLDNFVHLLGMELDKKKTYCWSTAPETRRDLRNQNWEVVPSSRDLGGHMQYNAQRANSTVHNKCRAIKELWPKLARSRAPRELKLKVVLSKAWPNCLHASATVHLHSGIFRTLRSDAMEAVFQTKVGASPLLQFSLILSPKYDPAFYALNQVVRQFRSHASTDTAGSMLGWTSEVAMNKLKPGPHGLLITKLRELGWVYDSGTQFVDEDHICIDVLHSPIQEISLRLQRAWCKHVGSLHVHRDEFLGLQQVDVALSRIDHQWQIAEHNMLRVLMNGTFCTNNKLHAAKMSDEPMCKYCGMLDSLEHRNLECTATEESRNLVSQEVLQWVQDQPSCIHRGWFVEPPSFVTFRKLLGTIPDLTDVIESPPEQWMHLPTWDVFTDGTAQHPTIPCARLCAWSVTMLPPSLEDAAFPLARGGLPGLSQTVPRAEATAFLSALFFVSRFPKPTRIWVDNQLVVTRSQTILAGSFTVTRLITDHDVWESIAECLQNLATLVTVHKVASHQDETEAEAWMGWAFRGNEAADRQAQETLYELPRLVLRASEECRKDWQWRQHVKSEWHGHLVRVAQQSIQHNQAEERSAPMAPTSHQQIPAICLRTIAQHAHGHAPPTLRFSGWVQVLQWMEQMTDSNGDNTEEFLTWYELLWCCQLQSACGGVVQGANRYHWRLLTMHDSYDGAQVTKSFSTWISNLIRLVQPDWKSLHSRPTNFRFRCWSMGLRILISKKVRQQLHYWMKTQLGDRSITKMYQVANLGRAYGVDPVVSQTSSFGLHAYFQPVCRAKST